MDVADRIGGSGAVGDEPDAVGKETTADVTRYLAAAAYLDEAFQALEEQDFERVPVVEDGRLVGILSRTVLQRRLAEDEPPAEADVG